MFNNTSGFCCKRIFEYANKSFLERFQTPKCQGFAHNSHWNTITFFKFLFLILVTVDVQMEWHNWVISHIFVSKYTVWAQKHCLFVDFCVQIGGLNGVLFTEKKDFNSLLPLPPPNESGVFLWSTIYAASTILTFSSSNHVFSGPIS